MRLRPILAALILAALLLPLTLAACAAIPHSAKSARITDACSVAALAIGDILKDRHDNTAARTRSPVLLGTPREFRILNGVEQPLDLRQCPAVATLALGSGMTLVGPGSPPETELFVLSSPIFSPDGNRAVITWTGTDPHLFGIGYVAVRTPLGWQLKDDESYTWVVTD